MRFQRPLLRKGDWGKAGERHPGSMNILAGSSGQDGRQSIGDEMNLAEKCLV
jgi:hypothetical protein